MMKYRVRFAPKAIADLEDILRYISEELHNPESASLLLSDILQVIEQLASFPLMGKTIVSKLRTLKEYRMALCKNYIIFYRSDNKTISVICVLYGRRDYINLLGEEK